MQRHARWVVHAVAHPFGDRRPQSLERVVKVLGMVNAVPDFKEHPKVIDGFYGRGFRRRQRPFYR